MRSNDITLMSPSELALHNALVEVEKLPADERVTNVISLILQAQRILSNYIDEIINNGTKR